MNTKYALAALEAARVEVYKAAKADPAPHKWLGVLDALDSVAFDIADYSGAPDACDYYSMGTSDEFAG